MTTKAEKETAAELLVRYVLDKRNELLDDTNINLLLEITSVVAKGASIEKLKSIRDRVYNL